ncbi:MAG: hypothetical protein A2Z88_09630 [Omnitrophica WOR_2 bacterium GWA2_47_8]|nr:MAG: hypothetical protein A2Z88_09630 [Omnitrophica WOR_2 bacterium GWA2_47_8]
MGVINVKKFALSFGLTFAFLRLLCVVVMALTPREATVAFFNTLLHGLDVSSVLRTDISMLEQVYGLIQIFVLGWLLGASIASIYNLPCLKEGETCCK